ncbi:hypothetical protein EK21DRAFT_106228 [Setomelanomma holmii]|uniref:Glycoside hydrolase family 5 protein n=1 Tax=Setomelanomma holmii TaxID=210430 RepID=A0A9P4LTT6_9PLEO|nr:hypothetical protein EK21DRAFT_106228 [Setomelanomma holmii]
MLFTTVLATLLSVASWTPSVAANLRITADHHSWGGVNYPMLQFFTPKHRDDTIRELVAANVRVIRLFIRPDEQHSDPEHELGGFDKSLLDQFDDCMAAVHHLSKGQMKVIIVPHDAHALRGSNDVPCDAYCQKLNGAFLDFYSLDEYRELYKTRLEVFFKHYPSKAFDGRPWGDLSEIILGVDLQNEPFSGIWPIPSGESWLCDIANHLKFNLGLDQANIAVISGGISGPQSVDGIQNFPDSAMECAAIDVIGIHGYFKKEDGATAGTSWANMFIPGNTLTARAKGKKGQEKFLLVEEWAYVHTKFGHFYKKEAIFDQGNALNVRGIPWLYSHLTTMEEGLTTRVNPLRSEYTSWKALQDVLKRSYISRSNSDWTKYLPAPPDARLTNFTALTLNPYIPEQSDCTFGCEGHLCDAVDGCAPDLICKNSVCQQNAENQPGKVGNACNSKKVCQEHLRCSAGSCQQCSVRPSIQPDRRRKRTIASEPPAYDPRNIVVANDINASCHSDSLPSLFALSARRDPSTPPVCLSPFNPPRGNPCESTAHCDADHYCNWGLCTKCGPKDSCLGAKCKSNNRCKTGFCNDFGRCDYPGQKKIIMGPGPRGKNRNTRVPGVPKGHERGPAKVRDEAMRVNIPKEGAKETGRAAATA